MITLKNGRKELFQWDIGQIIVLTDEQAAEEVHFKNDNSQEALVIRVVNNEAAIPNILLQEPLPIEVLLYYKDEDESYTIRRKTFGVIPRLKPIDYVYTETEVFEYRTILAIAQDIAASAEASATNVPQIINHTWWVWDSSNAVYVDTDKPASPDAEQLTTAVLGQISVHNSSPYNHADIREDIRTVEAIARGRATAHVFDTYTDMVAWLDDPDNVAALVVGDNLYIRDTGVKDYWWDGDAPQELEAEAPDLTDYYTRAQVDAMLPITLPRSEYDALSPEAGRVYNVWED